MTYKIGDIINEEEFSEASNWCSDNNATITEIEPDKDGRRFQIVEIEEHIPTRDEIKELRKQYRQQHIDDETKERVRKMANKTWTEEDEQEYLALDAEVTAWIEENLPYPEDESE